MVELEKTTLRPPAFFGASAGACISALADFTINLTLLPRRWRGKLQLFKLYY